MFLIAHIRTYCKVLPLQYHHYIQGHQDSYMQIKCSGHLNKTFGQVQIAI